MPKGIPNERPIEVTGTGSVNAGLDSGTASTVGEKSEDLSTFDQQLTLVLQQLLSGQGEITARLAATEKEIRDMKTGGVNRFKDGVKVEDVEVARAGREKIDPKVSAIVDEMLGEDFGINLDPLGDRPGFLFTLIVPQRLSDNVEGQRPVKDEATGQYKKDAAGNVVFEDYMPEDRRSRILSATDSYDAVKNHCERVRGHIVMTFQKSAKPLPEFKVR